MTKATKSKVARIVKNAETKRESIIKAQSEMLSALAKTVFVLTKVAEQNPKMDLSKPLQLACIQTDGLTHKLGESAARKIMDQAAKELETQEEAEKEVASEQA